MATWVNEVTTASGGNISMVVSGGYNPVSRSGNTVSFNWGVRFKQATSTYTGNSIAAFPGGTRYYAKNRTNSTSGTWYYAYHTSEATQTTESVPFWYSNAVSGNGAGNITISVGTGWDAWTPANKYAYSFSVPYPALGSPTGSHSVTEVTATSAKINGSVGSWGTNATAGSSSIVWGATTSYGNSTTSGASITGLAPGTTYYYRFSISNGQGMTTNYTGQWTTNSATAPTVSVSMVSRTSSQLVVRASHTNGTGTVSQYQFSKDNGSTWSVAQNISSTDYTFSGLTSNTSYNIRARANDQYTWGQSATTAMSTLAVPTIVRTDFTKTNVSIGATTIATAANGSSISGYSFRLNTGAWSTQSTDNTYSWGSLTPNTTYTITVRVYDPSNEYAEASYEIKTIASPIVSDVFATNKTSTNLNVKATVIDETGEPLQYRFSSDGGLIEHGKNLFDKNSSNILNNVFIGTTGVANLAENNKSFFLKIEPNTTYTISRITGLRFRAGFWNNMNFLGRTLNNFKMNDTGESITLISGNTDNYLIVQYLTTDTNGQEILDSIQVEIGSVKTSYEPYTSSYTSWSSNDNYNFTNLEPNTDYLIKAEARNIYGQIGSLTKTIKTLVSPPVITKFAPELITPTSIKMIVEATSLSPTLEYRYSKDNGATWTSWSANSQYNFTGLTARTTYQMKVEVRDNAAQVTQSSVEVNSGEPFKPRALRDGKDFIAPITSSQAVYMADGITTVEQKFIEAGKGGHDIQKEDGTTMPKQDNLQFKNTILTNDEVGKKTIVDLTDKVNSKDKSVSNIEYKSYEDYMTLVANNQDDPETIYITETDEIGNPFRIINDLVTGGANNALSAEQGKILDDKNNFSTAEIEIGKWIDGKTIYRRVYTFTTLSNIAITSFSKLINAMCVFQTGGQWRPVPWIYASGTTLGAGGWGGGFYISGATCFFQVGDNLGNISYGHLILEYIK